MTSSPDAALPAAITCRGVTRRFGRVAALSNLSVTIPEGAFALLVGANGAGKTTLLHHLIGLLAPSEGEIRVCNRDPAVDGALVRSRIGYVPEDGAWPFARQRLDRFLAYHAAYFPDWDPDYATHLAAALGLRHDRRLGSASKGEVRRAQLVAALAHRPPVLLLDEPTDGLDPVVRRRLLEILASHLAETPTTVVASTHQLGELEQFADHVVVMDAGRVVTAMDREELWRTVAEVTFTRPAAFATPEIESVRILDVRTIGHQERWLVEGPTAAVIAGLARVGIASPDVRALSLEDAAIAILSHQEPKLEVLR